MVTDSVAGFLLDTSVVSEAMRPRPARDVMRWLETQPEQLLYISVITLGEIRKGVELLDEGAAKRTALQRWLDGLRLRFADRALMFDMPVSERWGYLSAFTSRHGLTAPVVDLQLAATALHHGLTFVTRNTADVEPTGVPVFNPWGNAGR